MFLRQGVNEYGAPVTWFTCDVCGEDYYICPAKLADQVDDPAWNVCLAPECDSYDINRDVDAILFFGAGEIVRSEDNK